MWVYIKTNIEALQTLFRTERHSPRQQESLPSETTLQYSFSTPVQAPDGPGRTMSRPARKYPYKQAVTNSNS